MMFLQFELFTRITGEVIGGKTPNCEYQLGPCSVSLKTMHCFIYNFRDLSLSLLFLYSRRLPHFLSCFMRDVHRPSHHPHLSSHE